jgi:hypothetical protein
LNVNRAHLFGICRVCEGAREGHGLSETNHVIDSKDRCIAWCEKHFPKPGKEGITNVQPWMEMKKPQSAGALFIDLDRLSAST